jgi:hypothetical protein
MTEFEQIEGMTVNERLAHFHLFEAFDAAVLSRDLSKIAAVLRKAKLSEEQAIYTTETILSDPAKYGY